MRHPFERLFPIQSLPVVHCITNDITSELVANGLLFVGAKPFFSEDIREFTELFSSTDSLLVNLGRMTEEKEQVIRKAMALSKGKSTVLDLVGVTASTVRKKLADDLFQLKPTVVKGNHSEMRTFCGLTTQGRGVDTHVFDQAEDRLTELSEALKKLPLNIVYLSTGKVDLVVYQNQSYYLQNGVAELDQFVGTGDLVGALIAALLADGHDPLVATKGAVSYLNLSGERAKNQGRFEGLADFRHETMNQLSCLYKRSWYTEVREEI